MTTAPHRPRLVPKTTIIAAVVIVVLIAGSFGVAYLVSRSNLIAVPDVTGLPENTAVALLEDAGFVAERTGTRVSVSIPVGAVLEQDPPSDTLLAPGATVRFIVSAGPQAFVVPDLIGSPVQGAEDVLTALGFDVVIEKVSSETTAAVVLEMFPAPGASVSVGDEIRLIVPGDESSSDVLLPYDLSGVSVLLDPQPVPAGTTPDAPLEVARRLRSLFEAAGATVVTTRPDPGVVPTPESRESSASASAADLFVGIDVGTGGTPGLVVRHLPSDQGDRGIESLRYARAITRSATLPGLVVQEPTQAIDTVLLAFPRVGVRVLVGDMNAPDDQQRFADPAWADQVARAIYRGVGTVLDAE